MIFIYLLLVLWVHVVVETGPEPVALRVVEDGRDAVRHVDHAARLTRDDEQEPVRGLENQVLQLVETTLLRNNQVDDRS